MWSGRGFQILPPLRRGLRPPEKPSLLACRGGREPPRRRHLLRKAGYLSTERHSPRESHYEAFPEGDIQSGAYRKTAAEILRSLWSPLSKRALLRQMRSRNSDNLRGEARIGSTLTDSFVLAALFLDTPSQPSGLLHPARAHSNIAAPMATPNTPATLMVIGDPSATRPFSSTRATMKPCHQAGS